MTGNPAAGVALTSTEDVPPDDNQFRDNVLTGNGAAVVNAVSGRAPAAGNCVTGGRLDGTLPAGVAPTCPGSATRTTGGPLPGMEAPPGRSFRAIVAPPAQPSMASAATAPFGPAHGLPGQVDVAAVALPDAGLLATTAGTAHA